MWDAQGHSGADRPAPRLLAWRPLHRASVSSPGKQQQYCHLPGSLRGGNGTDLTGLGGP